MSSKPQLKIPPNMEKDGIEPFERYYHYHIPKCAGTTVNEWLDAKFDVKACRPSNFGRFFPRNDEEKAFIESRGWLQRVPNNRLREKFSAKNMPMPTKQVTNRARHVYTFEHFECFHGHSSCLSQRVPGSFVFTIVRDPVARGFSQYRDHARLKPHDFAHHKGSKKQLYEAVSQSSFEEVVTHLGDNVFLQKLYGDAQCRNILQDFVGHGKFMRMTTEERSNAAMDVVNRCMNVAGTLEKLDITLKALCSEIKCLPTSSLPANNVSPKSGARAERSPKVVKWLEDNNKADMILHSHVSSLIEKRRASAEKYDRDAFEREGVNYWLSKYAATAQGDELYYGMNGAFINNGFHGRDAAHTSDCARWSNGEGHSLFYVKVAKNKRSRIRLLVRGWSDRSIPETLQVTANDKKMEIRREIVPHKGEVLSFEVEPTRQDWVRIETNFTKPKQHEESPDKRSRGYLLTGYGVSTI